MYLFLLGCEMCTLNYLLKEQKVFFGGPSIIYFISLPFYLSAELRLYFFKPILLLSE